jgi:transcriptional antiterminator NusG
MGEKKWYVLRTAGSKEKKAKDYLEKEIERSNLQDQVSQILIPVKERDSNQKQQKERS